MNGSTVSASAKSGGRDLVVSVNWIGDAIMAMPALQVYRRLHPDIEIVVLARGALADVWSLHDAPDRVIRYDGRPDLFHPLYRQLRVEQFSTAWMLPNSFRSAWMMFRAGIPRRIGVAGGLRRPLLTERRAGAPADKTHQAWEYLALMAPGEKLAELPWPGLTLGDKLRDAVATKFPAPGGPVIGLIPGAARGPSKRWPAEHFTSLATMFVRDGYAVDLYGGPDDHALCASIRAAAGGNIRNLAGQTSIKEWAALMSACALVVANDSGGMHLAAALGRPVVALYGITDPERTGPIGKRCVILQNSGRRSRDIARDSAEAVKSLASIHPEAVYESLQALL